MSPRPRPQSSELLSAHEDEDATAQVEGVEGVEGVGGGLA